MAYREEQEHLRARVDELEQELETANRRIAELQGSRTPQELTFGEKVAGGPLRVVEEKVLLGEPAPEVHEEIVEILRRRYNVLGQASSVGKSLAWANVVPQSGRAVEVSVTARNGRTTIRGVERLGNMAGGLFGGIVGGLGGGGMGLVVPALMALQKPELLPFAIVLWIGTIYAIVRAAYGRVAEARARELTNTIAEIASTARESIAEREREKLRVEAEESEPEPDEEEAEAPREKRRARRE